MVLPLNKAESEIFMCPADAVFSTNLQGEAQQ